MTDRLYFKGHSSVGVVYEGTEPTGSETFDSWLMGKNWIEEMDGYDEDFMYYRVEDAGMYVLDNNGTRKEWVFNISEEWRHTLFDRLATEIDIDVAEKIIGEMGIRKVMKIVKDSGFYDEDSLPELWEDKGIRQVFYHLLDEVLKINDEWYEEITKQEYDEWIEDNIHEDDDDEPLFEEDDNDGAIVPITDEALALIGGRIASCA